MEHPHDPYHVRPFPQQPHRGGKELATALEDLESALTDKVPDFERLHTIQATIHEATNKFNDDKLIDMIRQMSKDIDALETNPERETLERILHQLLKVRVTLKKLK